MKLQEAYCEKLGLRYMMAPAQIVGREYTTDVLYALARTAETVGNLAHYVRWGRGDDVGIFRFPRKNKGSSAMPHKDAKGGNPTAEEQAESFTNYMRGVLMTSLSSCRFDYARDLSGSASDRIILEDSFKFGDHTIRNMAGTVAKLELIPERAKERVYRSFGAVTSQEIMNYLTDGRVTANPMSRDEAHELTARLATQAYDSKKQFVDLLLESRDVMDRLPRELVVEVADPARYIGQSKEIIHAVYDAFHGKKTFQELKGFV